jgi:kynureninase
LSIRVRGGRLHGTELLRRIEDAGVACDFRVPNVVRVAPVPLYNTFDDVYGFVDVLARVLDAETA